MPFILYSVIYFDCINNIKIVRYEIKKNTLLSYCTVYNLRTPEQKSLGFYWFISHVVAVLYLENNGNINDTVSACY